MARAIGGILGVLLGAIIALFLHGDKSVKGGGFAQTVPAAETGSRPPNRQSEKLRQQEQADLRHIIDQQAEELRKCRLKDEFENAFSLLLRSSKDRDVSSLDTFSLSLSSADLSLEIKVLNDDVAAYAADGAYAPQRHAELYKRANILFSMKGIGGEQSELLQQAISGLNELAVQHAEEAEKEGDTMAVVTTVKGLQDWSFRLTPGQRKRLTAALEASAEANGFARTDSAKGSLISR
jgi:hypothetical protein